MAEKTKLGWFVMSSGSEFDHNTMLLTQTSQSDYEELCRLDVLGLADTPEHDQRMMHAEFKEQLQRYQKDGMKPDYHGEAIIQNCQQTNKEVYGACQV